MSEEKSTTAPAVKPKAKKQAARAAENVVYIGPNKLPDGLKKFTVYRDAPAEIIETARAKYKNIARLFVPVGELNEAMKQVQQKGTPVYLAYREVEGGE